MVKVKAKVTTELGKSGQKPNHAVEEIVASIVTSATTSTTRQMLRPQQPTEEQQQMPQEELPFPSRLQLCLRSCVEARTLQPQEFRRCVEARTLLLANMITTFSAIRKTQIVQTASNQG